MALMQTLENAALTANKFMHKVVRKIKPILVNYVTPKRRYLCQP